MPRVHVAWIHPAFARLVLAGTKAVESRLSRRRGPFFGRVHADDEVFIRATGDGYVAFARVGHAVHLDGLTPRDVRAIRSRWGDAIAAPATYWRARFTCRYASLIWLTAVRPVATGPRIPRGRARSAWYTVGDDYASRRSSVLGVKASEVSPVAHS